MMSEDREPQVPEEESGAGASAGAGSRSGVSRRALFGGGAGIVAAGAVAAGIATDGFGIGGGSDDGDGGGGADRADADADGSAYVPPGASTYRLTVNGRARQVETTPDTMLLYVLRDQLGLRGPKFGCGLAQCGACAVLVDGHETRSCVTPVSRVGRRPVVTLEGLAASYDGPRGSAPPEMHPLQQAWIDAQVPQCGYCQSGMIIQAADLLSRTPNPSDAEIKQGMDPHLCRCGTHFRIMRAVRQAANVMSPGSST